MLKNARVTVQIQAEPALGPAHLSSRAKTIESPELTVQMKKKAAQAAFFDSRQSRAYLLSPWTYWATAAISASVIRATTPCIILLKSLVRVPARKSFSAFST